MSANKVLSILICFADFPSCWACTIDDPVVPPSRPLRAFRCASLRLCVLPVSRRVECSSLLVRRRSCRGVTAESDAPCSLRPLGCLLSSSPTLAPPAVPVMSDTDEDADVGSSQRSAGDNSQIEVYGRLRPSNKNDKSTTVLAEGQETPTSMGQ